MQRKPIVATKLRYAVLGLMAHEAVHCTPRKMTVAQIRRELKDDCVVKSTYVGVHRVVMQLCREGVLTADELAYKLHTTPATRTYVQFAAAAYRAEMS